MDALVSTIMYPMLGKSLQDLMILIELAELSLEADLLESNTFSSGLKPIN